MVEANESPISTLMWLKFALNNNSGNFCLPKPFTL